MTHPERLDRIEAYLREHRYADLHTLAETFRVSLSTVRRALNELETRGLVRRHHGGASLATADASGYDFITQDDRQTNEKHAIARAIAARIQPGMTVILDGGTTTYALARLLTNRRIVLVTNSLPIAALFNEVGSSEVLVTGGTVHNRFGVLHGPMCEASLANLHVDLAVLSGAGVTEAGVWNTNPLVVGYQQRMLKAAGETLFALDHTKFGKAALALVTPLAGFRIVTSAPPPAALAEAAAAAGTTFDVVPVDAAPPLADADDPPEPEPETPAPRRRGRPPSRP